MTVSADYIRTMIMILGWRRIGRRAEGRLNHLLEERNLKCGVYLKCRRYSSLSQTTLGLMMRSMG